MATLEFTTVIKIRGVNPYVDVAKHQAARLRTEWRKPMPVLIKINGHPEKAWRINMMPAGNGDFFLYLHGDVRKASGTKVGDEARIEIDFDKNYKNGPLHAVPEWFAVALGQNPVATKNWDKLPPSRQKEVLRYFAGLKSTEARKKNVERVMNALSGKPRHFMGRHWLNGS